jgi:membrane protease YdiL (CAAX protease family)
VSVSDKPSLPWWSALAFPGGAYLLLSALVSLTATLRQARLDISYPDARALVLDDPLNLGLVQLAAFGAAIAAAVYYFYRGAPLRFALGLEPVRLSRIALACVAGVSLQFVLAELSNVVQEFSPQPYEEAVRQHAMIASTDPLHMLGAIFAIVLIAPVTEELLFRGILVRGLAERYGRWFAIGLVAVTFGAIHMSLWAAIPAFVAGIVLGALADRYDSIWPSLAMHASVNAVPLLLPSEIVTIRGFNLLDEEVTHLPLPLLLASGAIALGALVFLLRPEPAS